MNDAYNKAYTAAMKLLINYELTNFPLDVQRLIKSNGVAITTFYKAPKLVKQFKPKNTIAFAAKIQDTKIICYDEKSEAEQIRYTLAHELAHIVEPTFSESQCQIFASRLLMPATICMLHNLTEPQELQEFFGVSNAAAIIRAERIKQLIAAKWQGDELQAEYMNIYKKSRLK